MAGAADTLWDTLVGDIGIGIGFMLIGCDRCCGTPRLIGEGLEPPQHDMMFIYIIV